MLLSFLPPSRLLPVEFSVSSSESYAYRLLRLIANDSSLFQRPRGNTCRAVGSLVMYLLFIMAMLLFVIIAAHKVLISITVYIHSPFLCTRSYEKTMAILS